nr:hypothetical protein [Tanacetum cinerariifolium]
MIAKTFANDVLPNHVCDKELNSIDGVGIGRMPKTKKDDMGSSPLHKLAHQEYLSLLIAETLPMEKEKPSYTMYLNHYSILDESAETGPPRVIVYRYDGLPIQPVALPSPDYVPGPEHPSSPDYVPGPKHPPSPVEIPYVPEPKYPKYLAPFDDEAPLKDQPLPADASPIAASPDYVANSNPEEDPEDPEDDQADYPAAGGDGDDEPSDDDDDDDTNDEDPKEEPFEDDEDDEEEEEHLDPADSSAVPIVDPILPAGDIETLVARKTVRPEPPMSASMKACIARHAALPSPPLLVPSLLLPFPSPLTTSPTDTGAPLGYRAVEIRMRSLLPSTSCKTDILEADMSPRKRACLTTPTPGFKVGESSAAGVARQPGPTESDLRRYRVEQAGYGITDTWDEIVNTLIEIAPTTMDGVDHRVTVTPRSKMGQMSHL